MILDDIALTFVPNLGSRGIFHLIDRFGGAEEIYAQSEYALVLSAELRQDIAQSIIQKQGYSEAERELRYCNERGITAISATDDLYPRLLIEVADRPHIVYTMGDMEALQSPHILSVVGTRRISSYGETICARLISELAERYPDMVVVSGLAFGVDAAAHRAALTSGIRTVAVLANTLPNITPATHRNLAKDILDNGGAILSELHSQSKQNGNYYIPRNRIVAGVADGLLVVESPANGGSLSTAKAADAYSRPIMAVPGRITDSRSEGTNHLIKTNVAQLVTSADDIASALGWENTEKVAQKIHYEPRSLTPKERSIFKVLECNSDGLSLDAIVERTGVSVSTASAILLNMELSGLVRQLPGKRYVIC